MTTLLLKILGNAADQQNVDVAPGANSEADYALQWVVARQDQIVAQGQATGRTLGQHLDSLEGEVLASADIVMVIPVPSRYCSCRVRCQVATVTKYAKRYLTH